MALSFRHVSLAIVLFAFWLALSGHYTTLLITIGVICVLGIVALSVHMELVDEESHPIHLALPSLLYWPWLIWQIILSAWGVARIIVDPRLPISPTMIRVTPTQKTGVGVHVYANSITLTPGTISVEVNRHEILVHAITSANAQDLAEGAMDRKVTTFEGSS